MSLSDKIVCTCGSKYINVKNVKEFIRELKGMILFEVSPLPNFRGISDRLNSQIDKLAGKELTNG